MNVFRFIYKFCGTLAIIGICLFICLVIWDLTTPATPSKATTQTTVAYDGDPNHLLADAPKPKVDPNVENKLENAALINLMDMPAKETTSTKVKTVKTPKTKTQKTITYIPPNTPLDMNSNASEIDNSTKEFGNGGQIDGTNTGTNNFMDVRWTTTTPSNGWNVK